MNKLFLNSVALWAVFLVFLSFPAKAHEHPQERVFKDLRAQAKPLDDLSSFLRMYIGDCQAGAEAAGCRQQSAVFRQDANQRSYVFFAFDEAIALDVRAAAEGQFRIGWLPFFSAFGYALSAHPPKQWNKAGLPIYSYMYLRGHLPPETSLEELLRWHKVGRLAAEVVFMPKGTWKATSSKTSLEGLKATWKAIRIFDSRSGETVGIWLN